MTVKLWLAGAVSAAAVTAGFAATPAATAATQPTAHAPAATPLRDGKPPPARELALAREPGDTWNGYVAGYFVLADQGVHLRYVSASFNVPSLNCAGDPTGAVTQGVGLNEVVSEPNGAGRTGNGADPNVSEVSGITESCNADGTYSVQGSYHIGVIGAVAAGTVDPGDAMTASVYYDDTTGQYTFTLTDVTTGQAILASTVPCPPVYACGEGTAEAVTGAASAATGSKLADYGMENFTGIAVTSRNGTKGDLTENKLWTTNKLVLNHGDGILATPSPLAGGSAFATTWHATG